MRHATRLDKDLVVSILTDSFIDNKSVNYLIPNDRKHKQRVRALMDYSFEICYEFGKVLITDGSQGVALICFNESKKTTLKSLLCEAKLILNGIGISNISKAIAREKKISEHYPPDPIYYLWFIAVSPEHQGKGIGTKFLTEIEYDATAMKRPIYLETSTLRNLPFYNKLGLEEYAILDFGYPLHLLRS